MSKIIVKKEKNILTIKRDGVRKGERFSEIIDLDKLKVNKRYISSIVSIRNQENYTILKDEIITSEHDNLDRHLLVYIKSRKIYYSIMEEKIYSNLVFIKRKLLKLTFNKKKIKFIVIAYIYNPFKLKIGKQTFKLDSENEKTINLNIYNTYIAKKDYLKNIHIIKFDVPKALSKEAEINNSISINLQIEGIKHEYFLSKKIRKIKDNRKYYTPIKAKYVKDFAIQIRRSVKGNLIFVRRKKEKVENTFYFRTIENQLIQKTIYFITRVYKLFNKKTINLYYEKLCLKAEEGTIDLVKKSQKSKISKNYFIINSESDYYDKIKDLNYVVKQFSLKFYFLYYASDNFIATEVPGHINLLRSNNKFFRKKLTCKKNIFLQHGIIYLKNLSKNTTFIRGKDGACDYIVASSKKECEVICDDFKMTEEEVFITGLGMFSNVKYNNINEKSENNITIMLTWKSYEEHLENFSKSSYYKNTIELYNIVRKYADKKNIFIVAHPRVYESLIKTDMKECMWQGSVSEVLSKTKLLITDYSSVCYNSFYQGAGVIFYQPDLELYETIQGKLIPEYNEYVGNRSFNITELDKILKDSIHNKKINLEKLRTKEHIKNYQSINEFNDGKNIDRIYEKLKEKNIV